MDLVFRRTGQRRYAIEALPNGMPTLHMDPAPGYDEHLPHDMLHATVEAVLNLDNAIFGQLASGGDAGSFYLKEAGKASRDETRLRRRIKKKGAQLSRKGEAESLQSERASFVCWQEWLSRSKNPSLRKKSRDMAEQMHHIRRSMDDDELEKLDNKMDQICRHLDTLSACWHKVEVGKSMGIRWPALAVRQCGSNA